MSDSKANPIQVSRFQSNLSLSNRLSRLLWGAVWVVFFRFTPRIAFGWRRLVLRVFGAKIGRRVRIYNSATVFLPTNLTIADDVVIGPQVDLYCVAPITISDNVIVSQRAELCTGTHDYTQPDMPLIARPITIESGAWICAGCFVGPGVQVGTRSVVGARAVVFKDVPADSVVAGNPAKVVKYREGDSGR
ncbi:LbetaH domain-containing protein [Crateriforma conspicua]|uniref:Maltose O-acetyltransferase n=1 Tax=Crateriforma conspicua TaxID=2527996 RepID=A0A5C5Y2K7_9PLAN|nr:putative colanic acid biosynthesis acetyltransferase [Crateriforma conspicua]TWT69059.1 Maltose O-acetyltransferase [Crateriforma conspicua]